MTSAVATSGLPVVGALALLWGTVAGALWWLAARRERRRGQARVERIERARRTVTEVRR